MTPILIIGSGMAGYTLAREIRQQDPDQKIDLISEEGAYSYPKPSLSNALIQGKNPEALINANAQQMAEKLGLNIHSFTKVLSINTAEKMVVTDKGEIPYGQLVLALGADPIRLALEGDGAGEVMSVNDLADYRRFREGLRPGAKVFILGAGLIGCEFANDLLATGNQVALADPAALPLSTLIPPEVGVELKNGLAEAGAVWHLGQGARAVRRGPDGGLTVDLSNGDTDTADLVLSAVGLRPRKSLAEEAGLEVNRGIVVDAFLRTSQPDVYALGDCAEVQGRWLPFVQPILHGARALAKTLTGQETEVSYPPMPVVVKTPACPLVVLPPPPGEAGNWVGENGPQGIAARFLSPDGKAIGFVLTRGRTKERLAFSKEVENSFHVERDEGFRH